MWKLLDMKVEWVYEMNNSWSSFGWRHRSWWLLEGKTMFRCFYVEGSEYEDVIYWWEWKYSTVPTLLTFSIFLTLIINFQHITRSKNFYEWDVSSWTLLITKKGMDMKWCKSMRWTLFDDKPYPATHSLLALKFYGQQKNVMEAMWIEKLLNINDGRM